MPAPQESHGEGAPEWMVSFADMVTILMAFFVVMYSMSGKKDEKKEQAVFSSLRRHLGRFPSQPRGRLMPRNSTLRLASLDRGEGEGDGTKEKSPPPKIQTGRREEAAVGEAVYFNPGSDRLGDEDQRRLQWIVDSLSGKPQRIEIRGYTTRRPLPSGAAHADHWDLAYARCRSAMEFLVVHGIEPRRIRLSVAAQHGGAQVARDPLLQVKDSRVDIFLLNEFIEQWQQP